MKEILSARELARQASGLDPASCKNKTKVAILGHRSVQFLARSICQAGLLCGMHIELYEAAYDQVEQEILNRDSGLYSMNPDVVFIVHSYDKLRRQFYRSGLNEKQVFSDTFLQSLRQLCNRINTHSAAHIILTNLEDLDDGVFGNFSNKTRVSFPNHVRRINCGLMNLAEERPGLHILDVARMVSAQGAAQFLDSFMALHADVPYSLDAEALIAIDFVQILEVLQGRFVKCIILDLDNTIWGGMAGDDGMEGIELGPSGAGQIYSALQQWFLQLKQRGIVLAVCSKNEEEIAKQIFLLHEEMILQLEDIAIFVANWKNKVDNIRYIQQQLQIGFDSMVFLDDSPVERAWVRSSLPEVWVPELPEDPVNVLSYLTRLNLFETSSFSEGDLSRTQQYRVSTQRQSVQQSFSDHNVFLQSLEMKGVIQPFQPRSISRIAQLSQRSNQFNLRTLRYSEEDVRKLLTDPDYLTFEVRLEDRFGSYGLISLLTGKQEQEGILRIENWIMSCRVIKRGVEKYVLNHLVQKALVAGIRSVRGTYLPTPKNMLVKHLFRDHGFQQLANGEWELEVAGFLPLRHFITDHSRME